mmetsp:Transcript_27725/g.74612  ORF Transcript_27725/g.74612 Transcript_27725/m.74612 type:complete len:215 (-) Transcript_27725:1144-1788(-)
MRRHSSPGTDGSPPGTWRATAPCSCGRGSARRWAPPRHSRARLHSRAHPGPQARAGPGRAPPARWFCSLACAGVTAPQTLPPRLPAYLSRGTMAQRGRAPVRPRAEPPLAPCPVQTPPAGGDPHPRAPAQLGRGSGATGSGQHGSLRCSSAPWSGLGQTLGRTLDQALGGGRCACGTLAPRNGWGSVTLELVTTGRLRTCARSSALAAAWRARG